jgi:formylglycine-generating enzyme required for sulfatase activity
VHDLAGNVWEWTGSLFEPYPFNATDGREALDSAGDRVLRGGSWFCSARFARAASRGLGSPDRTNDDRGFRLVLAILS